MKPTSPRVYIRPKNGRDAITGPLQAVIVFPDGRKERKATGFSVGQEKEAEAFRQVLEAELGGASPAADGGLTVRAWGERWAAARIARGVISADNDP